MTTTFPPICASCGRFRSGLRDFFDEGVPTCAAYPGGIPEAILYGEVDHRQPHDGDGGITWVLSDAPDAEVMLKLFEELTLGGSAE